MFQELGTAALELQVNSGFCLHFVIWLLFKLQSPFSHDCFSLFFSTHEGMETWGFFSFVSALKKQLLVSIWRAVLYHCFVFCRVHSCAFCLLPAAETSGWSQLLVQCATYWKSRGKVHVHAPDVCVDLFSCMLLALGRPLQMCSGNSWLGFKSLKLKKWCSSWGQMLWFPHSWASFKAEDVPRKTEALIQGLENRQDDFKLTVNCLS